MSENISSHSTSKVVCFQLFSVEPSQTRCLTCSLWQQENVREIKAPNNKGDGKRHMSSRPKNSFKNHLRKFPNLLRYRVECGTVSSCLKTSQVIRRHLKVVRFALFSVQPSQTRCLICPPWQREDLREIKAPNNNATGNKTNTRVSRTCHMTILFPPLLQDNTTTPCQGRPRLANFSDIL